MRNGIPNELVMRHCLIKDIKGLAIKEGDLFEFDFLEELDSKIRLKGSFSFNEDDLAYEIDIDDNEHYTCLNFANCNNLISNVLKTSK